MPNKMRLMKRLLHQRMPITSWLPQYNSEKFISDIIAGVTVGLTVMPQSLAYATLAGLEPQYGLYSAFVGCFVYAVFGSVKDITIGPTALMALMTYQQTSDLNVDFAILLCFFTGCVQMLMSLLHLGVLIDFISIPVTVGFTSATSVIIACSQLKGLLGLKFKASGFIPTVKAVAMHIHETRLWDTVLGFTCIVILLGMRKLKDVKPGPAWANRSMWLLSTARNALVVLLCSALAYMLVSDDGTAPFLLTGTVRSGLPNFGFPPFSTTIGNTTYSFGEMCGQLGSSIFLVPVIGVLGNVAIAKAFASGESVDATQEMLALGLCNIFGSMASSFPVSGSFSRSAVNHASGVKTQLGGIYTGSLILLALSLLTPYFYYIPKASLAAVIICAVIFMIEYEVVKPMWKSSRKDLVPTFVTFVACLVIGVELGILIGVAINILFLLYPSARPSITVERAMTKAGQEYLLVIPGNSLYFPAVDFIRTSVGRVAVQEGSSHLPVIVDCRYVLGADFTAAKGIAALIEDFNKRKQPIYFLNPHPDVVSVFKGASLEEFVHICSAEELEQNLKVNNEEFTGEEVKMNGFDLKEVSITQDGNTYLPLPRTDAVDGRRRFSNSVPLLTEQNRQFYTT
ncbi:sodium-independent sulfate anion transporter-like [Schistocerca gregaria]|uniref:sodium-independent sulfate anion transporter-like n=1 Tax=Schistocerca gregaria TaxID=7010 RepID=UPI00211E2E2B|nr:sodium-independent sulfate anion transporter-like [Schistocerca gregaria]